LNVKEDVVVVELVLLKEAFANLQWAAGQLVSGPVAILHSDTVLEEVVKVYRVGVHTLGIEVVDPKQRLSIDGGEQGLNTHQAPTASVY
jgi:hypothetical protein